MSQPRMKNDDGGRAPRARPKYSSPSTRKRDLRTGPQRRRFELAERRKLGRHGERIRQPHRTAEGAVEQAIEGGARIVSDAAARVCRRSPTPRCRGAPFPRL